jgi:hypothetical protein
MVSESSVCHDGEDKREQSSSHSNSQEERKGIQEENKTRSSFQGHNPMTYFLLADPTSYL